MAAQYHAWRSPAALAALVSTLALLAAAASQGAKPGAAAPDTSAAGGGSPPSRRYTTEAVRGRVVWLDAGLEKLYGVTTDPAAARTAVALETPQGQLLILVSDVRGHAFAVDERLRDVDLELLVRRYEGLPLAQVIRVLKRKSDGLYEIDYWCDICAIPMFTLKACECCQGPTRLRERLVEDATASGGR
jgi:hypothetical protein